MMRCCGVSPFHNPPLPAHGSRAPKVCRWVFAASTSGGRLAEMWVSSFDLARRNKAAKVGNHGGL
jgi:hypothetical protein